jgi:hypothetical protein
MPARGKNPRAEITRQWLAWAVLALLRASVTDIYRP